MAGNEVRVSSHFSDKVSKPVDQIRKKFEQLGKSVGGSNAILQGVGLAAGTMAFNALGSAIGSAAQFMGDSVRAASDLNESVDKSRVVFGASSREIEAWGATMATAGGLSKQAAIEAAGSFGVFFKGAGQSSAAAADMSQSMVQLASDLASFNNLDPTDALDKLRAGLAGESEPLRRVGVFLTEAKVKAKAMQMGLGGAHGELDDGAKILARYQLILEQTGLQQGNYAATAEGLANTERTLNAVRENTAASLGQHLLPVQKEITKAETGILQAVDASIQGWTKLAALLHGDLGQAFDLTADELEKLGQHEAAAIAREREMVDAADAAADATADMGDAVSEADRKAAATEGLRSFKEKLDKVSDAAEDAHDRLYDLGTNILDRMYGPAIVAGRLEELKQQLKDAKKEQKEFEEGSSGYIIAGGKVAELKQDIAELREEQAKAAGDEAYEKWLLSQIKKAEKAGLKTDYYVYQLYRLRDAMKAVTAGAGSTPTPIFGTTTARQHGGPVERGRTYLVGEHGPELFRSNAAGRIEPTPVGRPMGGGPLTVNVSVSSAMPYPPSMARELAQGLVPELTRELRRQGIVAA